MRTNLPVTQRDFPFADDATLLSTTDLDSYLTYANEAFIQVSGFTNDELVGQPHNIVRHPDMPVQAFADMWATLKAGVSWTALVKNRRKDGDHYWVRANATPIVRGGRTVGYMSVRTKPGADEVRQAEALYARFREGRAAGLAFDRGLIVRTGWLRWLSWGQTAPLGARVHLPLGALALTGLGALVATGAEADTTAIAGGAWVLGLGLLGAWLQVQVVAPLRRILRQAQSVASGNPGENVQLDRVDEIGLLLRTVNQAGLNLRSLVDDVSSQMSGLAQATREIGQGSEELRSRTEQASSALQQTAASMEQMTASVGANSQSARNASEVADVAFESAEQGSRVVGDVVSTMSRISDSARRIGDIIGLIDGIAFQTNILALNAAVEAARAGDHGRGFAVVAAEVRTLAQRSAEAAREIKALIQASLAEVESGTRLTATAGESVRAILSEVERVNALIKQISEASAQQSGGIASVNGSVSELDRMTQQNAALVEESSAATADLSSRSARLAEAIRVFRSA